MHLALNFQRVEPARGGAETYVADLCRYLVAAGHSVDLYAESCTEGCLPRQVNVIKVPAPGRTRLDRVRNFAKNAEEALRKAEYDCSVGFINTYAHDVIIPQGGVQQGSLTANAQRFSSSLVRQSYLLAKTANPKHWVHRSIERKQYQPSRAQRVVAVSTMVKHHLEQFHNIPRQQISVVPNAIDPKRLVVSQPGAVRCAFRNKLGLEPRDLTGLFVGHNFALKGLRPLLTALGAREAQSRGGRPIHLLICGNGDAGTYRRLAARLGLKDQVHFLGYFENVEECYWSSDFFVQPTYYDPCSLVVLEALACGLPVITTAQNGASELLSDGGDGFVLTNPDAQKELILALNYMASETKRRAMAAAAYRLGQSHTFELHVARLIAIFEEVAADKRRQSARSSSRTLEGASPHFERSPKGRGKKEKSQYTEK
jgi:UDP-glucose:(heptosyl)LPS alpha-1,3-glucosyltransferase